MHFAAIAQNLPRCPDAFCCDRSQKFADAPMHFAAIAPQDLPRCPDERSPTLDNSLTTIIQPTCSGLRKGESVPKSPHPHQKRLFSHYKRISRPNTSDRPHNLLKGQKPLQGDIERFKNNSKRRFPLICSIEQNRLELHTPPQCV